MKLSINQPKLGIQGAINHLDFYDILDNNNVSLFEIQLKVEDLFGVNYKQLEWRITQLKLKGIKVVLSHPLNFILNDMNVVQLENHFHDYFKVTTRTIIYLCEKFDIKCIVPMGYTVSVEENYLLPYVNSAIKFNNMYGKGKLIWQLKMPNSTKNNKFEDLIELIKDTSLQIAIDTEYLYRITKENNISIEFILHTLEKQLKYFHVVDVDNKYNSQELQLLITLITNNDYCYMCNTDIKNKSRVSNELHSKLTAVIKEHLYEK